MDAKEGEVEVTQYLRPDGRERQTFAPVGVEHAEKAKGMFLSAEELTTGQIAIYARFKDQDEEMGLMELADNGSGEHSPTEVLKRLIDAKLEERPDGNNQ